MSVHPSRQPIIRISKNGEMRLKNKVGLAILKENAYEERALGSELLALKKHKARQDKYLTYRQLDFASKQIAASEERPLKITSLDVQNNSGLPPLQSSFSKTRTATQLSGIEKLDKSQDLSDQNRKTQGNWEKAVMMVRMVQNSNRKEAEKTNNKAFITQEVQPQGEFPKELEDTTLPPLRSGRDRTGCSKTEKLFTRRLTFPEMIKISREKSMIGMQDPRFLNLESCLGGEKIVSRSARGRYPTHLNLNSAVSKTDSFRTRKLKTS